MAKKIVIVALLFSLAACTSGKSSETKSSPPAAPAAQHPAKESTFMSFDSATVHIVAEPPMFKAKDKCTLHVAIKNLGNGTLSFGQRPNPLQMFDIQLQDSNGRVVDPLPDDRMYPQHIILRTIQPGETLALDVKLSDYFPLDVPGRYRVRVAAHLTVAAGKSFLEYDSNWADLAVSPGASAAGGGETAAPEAPAGAPAPSPQ